MRCIDNNHRQMVTFFSILLGLLGLNAVLLIFSVNRNKESKTIISSKMNEPKIYTIDAMASKYKKAI